MITRAPNSQFSAAGCLLQVEGLTAASWEQKDLVLILDDTYEAPMQPFPANSVIGTRHGAVTMPGGQQLLSPSSLSSGAGSNFPSLGPTALVTLTLFADVKVFDTL